MTILLPLLVWIVGVIIMFFNLKPPSNAFWARVGEIMFFVGLFVFLLMGAEQVISLFQ